jgi:hypothetical protein
VAAQLDGRRPEYCVCRARRASWSSAAINPETRALL